MTAIVVILIGAVAFMLGYILGEVKIESNSYKKTIHKPDEDAEKIMEEYRNFLNYNGDEQ